MENRKIVKLQFDYLQGPIWISDYETGEPITGIDIIDEDKELAKFNKECSSLYSDCYEFDSHGEACWFNKKLLVMNKDRILGLISKIKNRITVLDENIVIEDFATPEIEQY